LRVVWLQMKRKELARQLARTKHLAAGAAQDRVDELVHDIVRKLRAGQRVTLPGFGELQPGKTPAGREKK
jgi:nucleoid DNA-binding protein